MFLSPVSMNLIQLGLPTPFCHVGIFGIEKKWKDVFYFNNDDWTTTDWEIWSHVTTYGHVTLRGQCGQLSECVAIFREFLDPASDSLKKKQLVSI